MENSRFKFRAWDEKKTIMHKNFQFIRSGVDGNDWIIFDSDTEKQKWDGNFNPYFAQQFKIMQYTGLKDKNGVEIYSGDLILLGKDSNGIIVGKVVYNEKDFGVPCYCIEEQYGSYQPFFAKGDNPKIWFEVIGNIYEHPHLLEHL